MSLNPSLKLPISGLKFIKKLLEKRQNEDKNCCFLSLNCLNFFRYATNSLDVHQHVSKTYDILNCFNQQKAVS